MTEQELMEVLASINARSPFEPYSPTMEDKLQYINQSYPSLLEPTAPRTTPMPTRGTLDYLGGDLVNQYNPLESMRQNDIFWGADNQNTLSLNAGGGTFEGDKAKGFNWGGRLGTNIPLTDTQMLSLGLSGGGNRVRYGIGTPYEGVEEQSKLQAIDATLADLARNQEFMAQIKRDQNNRPFYSLAYRKSF
jgi:hypothetical protein